MFKGMLPVPSQTPPNCSDDLKSERILVGF